MRRLTLLFVCILITMQTSGQGNKPQQIPQRKAFVLGIIEEIDSKALAEKRTINVYLPEGYQENDTVRYPVIYLLDGSADEDFIHVVGLVHFNSFPWIERVPKSIVVGIANTDRQRDFTYPNVNYGLGKG